MAGNHESASYSLPPPNPSNQTDVVVPPNPAPKNRRHIIRLPAALIPLSAAVYFFWPSDPDLKIVRYNLNNIQVHTSPKLAIDISLVLTVRVRNRNFFSFNYNSLLVSLGYRGRELGVAKSKGGKLTARGSSYIDTKVELDGFEILHDAFYLLRDLAKGSIPLDTNMAVKGKLGLLFYQVPLKVNSSEIFISLIFIGSWFNLFDNMRNWR